LVFKVFFEEKICLGSTMFHLVDVSSIFKIDIIYLYNIFTL